MDIVDGRPAQDAAVDGAVDNSNNKTAPATWDTAKHREESDLCKTNLADQGFNIGRLLR